MSRELEDDIEKIRRFYAKKVEDLQKKHENQIIAMKKNGSSAVSDIPPPPPDVLPPPNQPEVESKVINTSEDLSIEYREKIAQLEARLHEAEAALQQQQHLARAESKLFSRSDAATSENKIDIEKLQTELKKTIEFQYQSQLEYHRESSSLKEERLVHERELLLADFKRRQEEWLLEKDKLWNLLKEEESKSLHLHADIKLLKGQLETQSRTPVTAQFMLMESHITQLEQRIINRERESKVAIEESRMSARLELSRLQAIHEQVRVYLRHAILLSS